MYGQWRLSSGVVSLLHEVDDLPPERLLQSVWFHQRLLRDALVTTDGDRIRVLHPGFWNDEAGPDFKGAMIQFERRGRFEGDVEVDLESRNWFAHGHDRSPACANVVLHVIWDGDVRTDLPTLRLKPVIDSELDAISFWLGGDGENGDFPCALRGRCSAPLAALSDDRVVELLRQAAWVRFQSKAEKLRARARQSGWEQSLWEGVFRALGYKQNVWPMQYLGEHRETLLDGGERSALALQARLLGMASLLPAEIASIRTEVGQYLRQVWDYWWRDRDRFAELVLPGELWRFDSLRPANCPHRRLALASHWLLDRDLVGRIEAWSAGRPRKTEMVMSLLDVMQVEEDPFWSWQWSLGSSRMDAPRPLLGVTRLTDLAINVVLPWLWGRALDGDRAAMREEVERRYFDWPAAQGNAVLKLARNRLLGCRENLPMGAALQQGVLQTVRDFCDRSNAVCDQCQFPRLVGRWGRLGER